MSRQFWSEWWNAKKRKIITSTVKGLISDYGGKKWSQLQLVVYENGREYIYIFFFQFFFQKTEDSQRGEREMVRAWAPNSRARFQAYSGNSDGANRPGYEADNITVLQILTASEIKANKADIVIKNKQEKSCLLIDMSNPTEKNTSVHVTEKLSKNKDLEIKIETMWGMKATTIPVVTGVLGLTKKGLEKYIRCTTNPGEHQNTWTTEDHTTWNISHPKKGNLVPRAFPSKNGWEKPWGRGCKKGTLLGPRNGLGCYVVLIMYWILTFSFYEYFTEVLCAAF